MDSNTQTIFNLIDAQFEEAFFIGMARMMTICKVHAPNMKEKLAHEHMLYVYENISKKKTDIIAHTGYSAHHVKKFLEFIGIGKLKPQKRNSIFQYFLQDLQHLAEKSKNKEIPLKGFNSFNECFNRSASNDGYLTAKSVLFALEEAGCIKIIDKTKVRFLSAVPDGAKRRSDLMRQFSNLIYRFSHTQDRNFYAECKSEELLSMDLSTNEIPEEEFPIVRERVRELSRVYIQDVKTVLEEHEVPGHKNENETGIVVVQYENPINKN